MRSLFQRFNRFFSSQAEAQLDFMSKDYVKPISDQFEDDMGLNFLKLEDSSVNQVTTSLKYFS